MFEFLSCIVSALAVVSPVLKNLGEISQGSRRILNLAGDIFDRFRKQVPQEQQQSVMRRDLEQAAQMPQTEFDKKAEEIVELVLADQSPEVRHAAANYLKLIPARIRATFRRPDDPTGTTVPAMWTVHRLEDIIPLLPPRMPLFHSGDLVPDSNRWILIDRLGIGGFGEVWKARNREDDFSVFKFCLDPESQKRMFTHERKIIKIVKNELDEHKNVVKLMDSHLEGATPWLQYEFAPGGDLQHNFATWPKDLADRVAKTVETILILAETMAECHTLKPDAVIHRDLKPANIVIGKKGDYKIIDFGIGDTTARQALEEDKRMTSMTMSTPSLVRWANTPMYASPQQKKGDPPHPADDVHAIGVMLYQMILGDINRPLNNDYTRVLERKHVCRELIDLITKSIASDLDARYQHAGELVQALTSLPKNLIDEPILLSREDKNQQVQKAYDRLQAEAKAQNDAAREQLVRREWATAAAILESISPTNLRDEELYSCAVAHRDHKQVIISCGIEFVIVPKGTFWMGGGDGKCGNKQVTIDHHFYIGTYPVTQEEWQKIMGSNPSHFRKDGPGAIRISTVSETDLKRFPVECVTWHACQQFVDKLNENEKDPGWIYRLPSEVEWEYACRDAGTSQTDCSWNYYFQSPTNDLSSQQANFGRIIGSTTKVGCYPPNSLGIFDMHGNVWEWCNDSSWVLKRLLRGGSWYDSPSSCQASHHTSDTPRYSHNHVGLRLVRVRSDTK